MLGRFTRFRWRPGPHEVAKVPSCGARYCKKPSTTRRESKKLIRSHCTRTALMGDRTAVGGRYLYPAVVGLLTTRSLTAGSLLAPTPDTTPCSLDLSSLLATTQDVSLTVLSSEHVFISGQKVCDLTWHICWSCFIHAHVIVMVECLRILHSLCLSFAQQAGQGTHAVELGAQDITGAATLKEEVRTDFMNLLFSERNGSIHHAGETQPRLLYTTISVSCRIQTFCSRNEVFN